MAEIQLQLLEQKTLRALSQMAEPARPAIIAGLITGETALNIGNSLRELVNSRLAELIDKKGNTWQITDRGMENIPNIQVTTETVGLFQLTVTVPLSQTMIGLWQERVAVSVLDMVCHTFYHRGLPYCLPNMVYLPGALAV